MKNNFFKRRRLLLVVFIIVAVLFTGFTVSREIGSTKELHGKIQLSGKIISNDGSSVEGLELALYANMDSYPENPLVVSSTKKDGRFKMKTGSPQPYVLEVRGKTGAGRVFLPFSDATNDLEITYPIQEKIVVLHTNDLHFTLNKTQEFAAVLERMRKENKDVYLLSAGDIFVRHKEGWRVNDQQMGTDWYLEKSMNMIRHMNKSAYDVMAPGNHDLGYIDHFTREALDSAKFPLIAANIEVSTDKFPPVKPYVLFSTSTWRKIAVLGLVSDKSIKEGLKELDVSETARKYLSLRSSSDIFLALTHVGTRKDRALANEFPEFDAIIGGHSHDLLREAITLNNVLIAQAGGNKHVVSENHKVYLGIIEFILENGILKEKKGRVIEI
ncbi:MAG: metallophosphoesterase [Prolixibacteraceae bacterium]|nr:metallophosphoesterase [Prolixibacteraceae bacterium]